MQAHKYFQLTNRISPIRGDGEEEEITKGINNIQLYFDGERYFIVSIFWDANAKNIAVPDRYLPKDKNTDYHINL